MDTSLAQLKDIHLPSPPTSWPPDPIWWAIALAALIGLFLLKKLTKPYRRRRRQRRDALQALHKLLQEHQDNPNQLIPQLSKLLRVLAIRRYGRDEAASLIGDDWLQFLAETGRCTRFREDIGQLFVTAPYDGIEHKEVNEAILLVRTWIKRQ